MTMCCIELYCFLHRSSCNGKPLEPIKILLWTPYLGGYENWRWYFPNSEVRVVENETCELRCAVTDDKTIIGQADVVYFSLADINRVINSPQCQNKKPLRFDSGPILLFQFTFSWTPKVDEARRRKQIWIAHWFESSTTIQTQTTFGSDQALGSLNNTFNWTISYRNDSLVKWTYAYGNEIIYTNDASVSTRSLVNKTKYEIWISLLSILNNFRNFRDLS